MQRQGLAPGLLLAAPPLGDPNFERSVVVLAQHTGEGALGWVANGPELSCVERLLRDSGLTPEGLDLPDVVSYASKVRVGGPVSQRSAWLLYRRAPKWEHPGEIVLSEDWAATGSRDLIERVARGEGPLVFRFFLGYSGWAAEQLEAEVGAGAWMPARFDEQIVFETEPEPMWQEAYERLIGVSPYAFTSLQMGSA